MDPKIYSSLQEKSQNIASEYTKTVKSISRYLAYRDIPSIIQKYVSGNKALDFGSGTGISSQFLHSLGLDVTGCDISQEMLKQAKINYPPIPFFLLQNGEIPSEDSAYDLVFSSFVLFEISSKEGILKYLNEAARVLKKGGIFLAITGSDTMFSHQGIIYGTDFPENKHLKSGDLAKVLLNDIGIEFTDYYWTSEDWHHFFKESPFTLLETHHPLGKREEPYPWIDELTHSPYLILVARN